MIVFHSVCCVFCDNFPVIVSSPPRSSVNESRWFIIWRKNGRNLDILLALARKFVVFGKLAALPRNRSHNTASPLRSVRARGSIC